MTKRRKETRVRNEPYIYKIEALEKGKWKRKCFRVQRKIKTSDGKRKNISEVFDNIIEARQFRDKISKLSVLQAQEKRLAEKSPKFKDVFDRFINHKRYEADLQETTLQKYQQTSKHLEFFFGMKVNRIDVRTVDGWVNLLRDPEYIRAQTQKRINYSHEFDLLRNIFNYYVEFENEEFRVPLLNRHRKRLCSRPKHLRNEIKFLRPDQFDGLLLSLESFRGSPKEMMLARLMRFQLETGLRIGEAAALEYHQIVFSRKEVIINQRLQWDRSKEGQINVAQGTKGGPSRIVYMSRTCEAILRELYSEKTCSKVFNHDDQWREISESWGFEKRNIAA